MATPSPAPSANPGAAALAATTPAEPLSTPPAIANGTGPASPTSTARAWEALRAWDEDERFYRAYRAAQAAGPEAVNALVARTGADKDYVAFAQDPACIPTARSEDEFFPAARNVALVKHPRCLPPFSHAHAFFEALYVAEGSCAQTVLGTGFELHAGDMCFIAPDTPHRVDAGEQCLALNVLARTSTFADIFTNDLRGSDPLARFFLAGLYGAARTPYLLFRRGGEQVRGLVGALLAEQDTADAYTDRALANLLSLLLVQLLRQEPDPERAAPASATERRNAALIDYLVRHSATATLADTAQRFGYTVPYCSRLVKKLTGMPFSAFETSVRMGRARNLLRTTALPVAAVGAAVGYETPETFLRAFKRTQGATPSAWRAAAQAGADGKGNADKNAECQGS